MQQSGEALGLPGGQGMEEDMAAGAVVPTGSFFKKKKKKINAIWAGLASAPRSGLPRGPGVCGAVPFRPLQGLGSGFISLRWFQFQAGERDGLRWGDRAGQDRCGAPRVPSPAPQAHAVALSSPSSSPHSLRR